MDEDYSSGTVQDFHLIPFSSVFSLIEMTETKQCKVRKKNHESKDEANKIVYLYLN
jgi:hypothetical protein